MKVPKITSFLLVALTAMSTLNFVLKSYTYFVLMVSLTKSTAHDVNNIAEETGEIPHPHELYVPLLTFIPTRSPVFSRIWVLITSCLIEDNFIGFSLSFFTVFYLGRYLENIWGAREYGKFIGIVSILANLLVYLWFNLESRFSSPKDVPPVVATPMAVIMGFFVAIKQRIPNHYFILFRGNLRLKVKHLPFILMLSCLTLLMLSEEFRILYHLSVYGFILSWSYLRYFRNETNERQSYVLPFLLSRKKSNKKNYKHKRNENKERESSSLHLEATNVKGDRSEQFSLYTFFPVPLSIIIKWVSSAVFNLQVKYNLVDAKNYINYEDDHLMEDTTNLQSNLFDLSSLNGVEDVSTILNSPLKTLVNWFHNTTKPSVKTSMDKRRKQALKQLE